MTRRPVDHERSAAMRSVITELGTLKGQPRERIERAAIDAMAQRGVTDVRDGELTFMVDAIQTSIRRALWKVPPRLLGQVVLALRMLKESAVGYSQAEWMTVPDDVGRPPEGARCDTVDLEVGTDRLTAGRPTIARVLDELIDQSGERDDHEVRPVSCWLSLDAGGSVLVHIGPEPVATIPADEAPRAAEAIREWGSATGTVIAGGDLHGDSTDTARLELWFPAPAPDA